MKSIFNILILYNFSLSCVSQTVTIPDIQFLNFLISQGVDVNGDGVIQTSEAELIDKLTSDGDIITDYTGINAFANLDSLTITNNWNLENLQLSSLSNLVYFNCRANILDVLNLDNLSALEYLNCESNRLNNIDLSGLPRLDYLDCSHNAIIELDFGTTPLVKSIDCSSNYLSMLNLSNLPSLEFLNCNSNQIATLSVSDKPMLHSINCEQNEMTDLTMVNIPGLKSLNCRINNLAVVDVSALDSLITINCFNNDIVILDVSEMLDLTYLNCNKNEIEVLDVANLTKLERLECEVNEFTELDVSRLTELRVLDCSNSYLQRLDVTNLSKLEVLDCLSSGIRSLNLSNLTQECEIDIRNMINLETLFIKNGIEDDLGDLWGLDNLYFVCADDFELDEIQLAFGNSNLIVNSFCPHTNGGLPYFVKGQVLYTQEGDICENNSFPIDEVKFRVSDGIEEGFISGVTTDGYSLRFNEGDFTITPEIDNSLFIVDPEEFDVAFPQQDSIVYQDICIRPRGVQPDVSIVFIPVEAARPGFETEYKIIYTNNGNTITSGDIRLFYQDNFMEYLLADPIESNSGSGSLIWQYSDLMPFESREILLSFRINSPMDSPPVNGDDVLSYIATITLDSDQDIHPVDNQSPIRQIVVNSFDPNDKTCLEGTKLEPHLVGEFLHYMIRFENTGTADAINIVVRDSLDSSVFQIETLEIVSSSHRMNTVVNGDIVEFIFADIYLPSDDENNDGYLIFKIKTKNDLVIGDLIENTAAIYFDYNFPIITNTASTVVEITSSINETLFPISFEAFPNPSNGQISVKSTNQIQRIEVSDLQGHTLLEKENIHALSTRLTEVDNLTPGIYFITVFTEMGSTTKKIILNGAN